MRICSVQMGMSKAVKVTTDEISEQQMRYWAESWYTWGPQA